MLVEEYRGDLLENTHDGRICVCDSRGNVLRCVGDAHAMTYFRSSSKPFQALPLLMRGLDKKYGLDGAEITACAGSLAGENIHAAALESILKKAELSEDDLIMLPTYPAHAASRDELIRLGLPARKLYHNCAGKHLALMMLARELGGDYRDYWKPESPAQQEILSIIADVSGFPKERIIIGVDGCGVPVFAVPLKGIATAYARLADSSAVDDAALAEALSRMARLIGENPYMMRGHGYICGEINTFGNIVAKGGAQGVYGFGLKKERVGAALKISDGSEHAWPLIIAEILRQLDYDDASAIARLDEMTAPLIRNDAGSDVCRWRTVFNLR